MRSMCSLRKTVAIAILVGFAALGAHAQQSKLFGISAAEYASRRAAVRAAAKGAIVIIQGPTEAGDIELVRFRTRNEILYLTGVEASAVLLAILPEGDPSGKREMLFVPAVSPGMSQWVDAVPGPGPESEALTGIQSIVSTRAMWEKLEPSVRAASTVRLVGAAGQEARFSPNGQIEERLKRINPAVSVEGRAERLINPLRWRKSAAEADNLRKAIDATGIAQRNCTSAIRPGATELEVEGAILAGFRKGLAVREGFPCIVGSGPNSCILHHFSNERVMRAGEVVVVDIGAEYNYYSADVTRTFPVSGKFTPRQRDLYQLVLDTQRACEAYVKPGKTTMRDLDMYARGLMAKSPLRAKDRDGNERTMDSFFAHGLGHWLGMDVHDVQGDSNVLMPGTVFTIEPGVYIASEGHGFRIEDDYLVTETGLEKLSRYIPSEIAEIEALMRPKTAAGARTPARGNPRNPRGARLRRR